VSNEVDIVSGDNGIKYIVENYLTSNLSQQVVEDTPLPDNSQSSSQADYSRTQSNTRINSIYSELMNSNKRRRESLTKIFIVIILYYYYFTTMHKLVFSSI